MGAIGGMTGTAGGVAGTGMKGPEGAHIQDGTDTNQVQGAQNWTNAQMGSQNALLSALAGQNGVAQQNNAAWQQQALSGELNKANAVGKQNQAYAGLQGIAGQQQNTANQYQNIANGTGPNPAQAMLNQQTGQNVANQSAMMAGQRGAGSNVGLMARQAAQQGAATQQQAVGQGATMQANQQIAGLQGLAGQQSAMANTQQALGGMGNTQLSAQMGAQQAMANQANAITGQQIGQTNANTQAAMSNAGQQQNALASLNNANVAMQSNINNANAGLANTQMQGQQKVTGGLMGGAGSALGLAGGGVVQHLAAGGPAGPSSSYGQFLNGVNVAAPVSGGPDFQAGPNDMTPSFQSKKTPGAAPEAGGEAIAGEATPMAPGTMVAAKGGLASTGGKVHAKKPSEKANVKGDSYSNDKINAKLSESEIVLPRSVTLSGDPVGNAAKFVAAVLAKRKARK